MKRKDRVTLKIVDVTENGAILVNPKNRAWDAQTVTIISPDLWTAGYKLGDKVDCVLNERGNNVIAWSLLK